MKKGIIKKIIVSVLFTQQCYGVSFVYNLRIAEITKRQATDQQYVKGPFLGSITFIDQLLKKYNDTKQNTAGALGALIYFRQNIYARIDFAFAHIREKLDDFHLSRIQTDDILLSGGYSYSLSDRTRFTLTGLFGIPTHKDTDFEGIQFGTGHLGLGIQLDNVFYYTAQKNHSLRSAVRYIRFLKSNVTILGFPSKFKFSPGNLIDLLLAHHTKFGKQRFEFGYDATFLINPTIEPPLPIVLDETTFIRHNFYAAYQYIFFIHEHPADIVLGASYGFDHQRRFFNIKRLLTFWAGFGINF